MCGVCVCVCVRVRVHVCVHACVCVCMYVCACAHICDVDQVITLMCSCVEDSVDTPTVLHHMRGLVTLSNSYISEHAAANVSSLIQIAKYLTYLLKVMMSSLSW